MTTGIEAATASYCERWSGDLRGPVTVIDEADAKARNKSGLPFGVVLGDPDEPDAYLDVDWGEGRVVVWFFGDGRMRTQRYTFERVEPERLFMAEVAVWDYPPDATAEFTSATLAYFVSYQQDGIVRQVERNYLTREETVVDVSDVELDINWEGMPRFGDWAALARRDRGESA